MTRQLGILWLALLLGACAPLPTPELPDAQQLQAQWQRHVAQVEAMEQWGLRGRFGVMWSEGQLEGSVIWRQHGSAFDVALRGPFGAGAMRLIGDWEADEVMLQKDGQEYTGALAPLMREHLGVELPLADLARLARGLPLSEEARLEYDAQARARRIEQGSWEVEYEEYGCCDEPPLPERLRFQRDSLRGVLAVIQWTRE